MLTVEQILRGTSIGRMQSVGQMDVIPVLAEEDDESLVAPDLRIGTTQYGRVDVTHLGARPTLVPPGAAWIVAKAAQDHAIGGGVFVKPGDTRRINGLCVQQTQPGLIQPDKHPMVILPLPLRLQALAVRHQKDYSQLWEPIGRFNETMDVASRGNLSAFLDRFKKELDQFVAEFELVPRQVGAIVLVGGEVVGVERAPSVAFWEALWQPLIRVCYGATALRRGRQTSAPPTSRFRLNTNVQTLDDLADALKEVRNREDAFVMQTREQVGSLELRGRCSFDDELGRLRLQTLASPQLSGQVVLNDCENVVYASLGSSKAA